MVLQDRRLKKITGIAGHNGLWRLFKPPGHKIVRRAEKKDRHCESIAPQTGDPYFR